MLLGINRAGIDGQFQLLTKPCLVLPPPCILYGTVNANVVLMAILCSYAAYFFYETS